VRIPTALASFFLLLTLAGSATGQEDESSLSVNGYVKLQSGVFVPMLSNMFKAYENESFVGKTDEPCDPVMVPNKPCTPTDHGQEPGSLSMFRATLQLEADWKPYEAVAVHAILRGARSLMTDADGYAQMPRPSTSASSWVRREEARQWVLDNYYTELDLREFYVDVYPAEWLSFRIGRQQVTWGETGQFRLLDVINPIDGTWHFSPLESFEDTRIPLWIVKGLLEFPSIDHSLELVWVPGIDRPEDMVTVPLTFVGAWGLPYSNTPSPFIIDEKVFMYPKNSIEDTMRVGLRWKGVLSTNITYTLAYYYTHLISPPIPMFYDLKPTPDGYLDPNHMERLYLGFPRQHIAGFSFDFTLENPIGAVVKLEAAIEPDRTFPQISTTRHKHQDPDKEERYYFDNPKRMALSYALVVMRPTMIRFLNPTQNFMMVFQFMHTMVPGLTEDDKSVLVEIPGFNDYKVKQWDSMKFIFATFTQYLHGLLTPKLVVAYIYPDSAFVSASLAVRLGDHWRVMLTLTDFYGKDPYKGVGLFRDRDEINLSVLCQF
jgi:hypothetical protein